MAPLKSDCLFSYFTYDPWACLRIALSRFHVPSYWGAISSSIEWYRVGAVSGSHLTTTPTGDWAGRPLCPFIISTRNYKEILNKSLSHLKSPVLLLQSYRHLHHRSVSFPSVIMLINLNTDNWSILCSNLLALAKKPLPCAPQLSTFLATGSGRIFTTRSKGSRVVCDQNITFYRHHAFIFKLTTLYNYLYCQ